IYPGHKKAHNALQKAYALFCDQDKWLPPYRRIEILERAVAIMKTRVDALTNIAAQEGGKPYIDSKIEVERAINSVKIAAEYISHIKGEQIPMELNKASVNRIAFTTKEPIGVVFSICAFNHPLNLVVHQTATAIAAGCPVIIKPASATPLSCLNFIEILKEAGLPEGWCETIICSNDIAEKIATDTRINYLSFIGSAKVGWYLRSKIAPGTRCALEHGGAAPVIIEPDADINALVPLIVKGGFYHAGQVCVSVQRVFIHKDICDEVSAQITAAAKKLITGDPMDPKTEVGPLIAAKEVDRINEWVKEAIDHGATLLCGGNKISDTCYEPTVLLNPPQNIRVSTQEIFGPVICIYSYNNLDETIHIANNLNLHFQSAVFTKNIDTAFYCIKKLNAIAVMVNDHTAFRVDWMPFGGRDASGLGMGGVPYTINEMLREKLLVIKTGK
ncbi:MAG: aldehyde dehydrogenase family protein, partial [Chitinophagaceae bacterium]|nr:aldehyde dehydrogenase family protein [Chitinophagaceae bacterium]